MKRGSAKSKIVHQSDSQKKLNRPLLRALAKAYRGENDIRDFLVVRTGTSTKTSYRKRMYDGF